MTATAFTPARVDLGLFRDAGCDPPDEAFTARILVGANDVSRGVPHVNNAEYVRWIDRIAELATDAGGFTRDRMLADGHMWFVARHEVDYRGEAFVGEDLVAATWLDDWSRTTVRRHLVVVRPKDERLICVAATRWAYVDLERRRPARIPAEMRAAYPPPGPAESSS